MWGKKKVIGVYAKAVRHSLEGFAYLAAWNGAADVVFVTDPKSAPGEHPWCLARMRTFPGIQVVPYDSEPIRLDHLFIALQSHRSLWDRHLNRWLGLASNIGGLSIEIYSQGWRAAARELIRCLPYSVLMTSAGFEAPKSSHNPYFWVSNRFFLTPTPHPQFLVNAELRKLMFGPILNSPRLFRLQFIGSNTPLEERGQVLARVRAILDSYKAKLTADPQDASADVFWMEYGAVGGHGPRGLSPEQYVQNLDQSTFVVCPLGWGGVWTHRAVESVLRGAIPILPEWSRYNLGLCPGVNCIGVRNGQWDRAIRHAWLMPPAQLERMQTSVFRLRESLSLDYQSRRLLDAVLHRSGSAVLGQTAAID